MSQNVNKNILIAGLPGVGKTTLVKKIATKLIESQREINGFFTEEVREKGSRSGFDIVTLKRDAREVLARKNAPTTEYQVGPYTVFPTNVDKIATPILQNAKEKILIIDEIGKMELLSRKFESAVKKVMDDEDVTIIATVPLKGGGRFVDLLKNDRNNRLLTVTEANRDQLFEDILVLICK